MKSWADHCSSDEESFNEDTPMEKFEDTDDEVEPVKELEQQMDQATIEPEVAAPPPAPRTYDFPAGPPYTLFVGNLSYSIKDGNELGDALANLVKHRLNQDIKVIKGRIGFDRQNPSNNRHKGFGYVEVSSLEEMKLTLELNMDPGAQLAGRKVQLDTANHTPNHNNNRGGGNRRASAPEVDGRNFRQGKFNKNTAGRGGRRQSEATTPAPPTSQRPSLKLAPRTKPLDSDPVPAAASKSDIFGGAKPRDTNPWNNKPKPAPPAATTETAPAPAAATVTNNNGNDPKHNHSNNHNNHNHNNRRSSGRGGGRGGGGGNDKGRGRGGGGRGGATSGDQKGGKGGKNHHNKNANKAPPAEKKTPVAPPAAAAPAPAEEKRASNNRFAAFAFDSDSD